MPYLPTVGAAATGLTDTLNYLLKGRTNGNVICMCTYDPNTIYEKYIVSCRVCKQHKLLDEVADKLATDDSIGELAAAIIDFSKDHVHDPTLQIKTERKFR